MVKTMTACAGFHSSDAWTFEVFYHPLNDVHGPQGWYWWDCMQDGEPISDFSPAGPFKTSEDAYLNAIGELD
jgi:hypothetical protein